MPCEFVARVGIHPSRPVAAVTDFWCYRFTASNSALWDLDFANGTHVVKDFPQLWWRKFRNFNLAETENLSLFDNPELCFSAQLSLVQLLNPSIAFS